MYIPTREELQKILDKPLFHKISETADELGMECYIVGGYVRDIFLQRPSTDIDVVVVGKGIEMARAFSKKLGKGAHLAVYANFGTAQVKYRDQEIEFVGARKAWWSHTIKSIPFSLAYAISSMALIPQSSTIISFTPVEWA